ncbi:hypothetical protein [Marivita sp. GX14005]|uniref:N-acyl amino acid synthase FeeM domain-containing protein n=1 Tax=Marivita sp. GX14005 TaxID=2942276 RepID=UPI002018CA1C|nr:hypothetical protein [Marivita sp. GX14005]MCL3883946.1 hypothetical protein [Marivita sp. GX14005]
MTESPLRIVEARSDEDLRAVGAFRYRCYLAEGLIDPCPEECFVDAYDAAERARVFMILSGGRIVGSIRLHILDRGSHVSATMAAFPDILMPKLDAGLTLIDGARFAVAPDLGALRLPVARRTLRLYSTLGKMNDADYGVAAIRENRTGFYRRLYGFRQIAPPRPYGALKQELALVGVDLRSDKPARTPSDRSMLIDAM